MVTNGLRIAQGYRSAHGVPWGAIDLISAVSGEMEKHYRFVYVYQDNEGSGCLKRIRKDNYYYWYRGVIESNGKQL